MASQNEKDEFCAVCNNIAKQKCSSCKQVYYCSREHQKSDWKSHAKNCQSYEIVKDPTIGRHYVATRKIKIGEIVMCDEEPLLFLLSSDTKLACLNCYVPLTFDIMKPCNNCGWPLCVDCTEHGPECELTIKYRKIKIKFEEYPQYIQFALLQHAITVMRVLSLREKNPNCYKKLMNLEDHRIMMLQEWTTRTFPICMTVIQVARLVKEFLKIDDFDEIEITRIIGITVVNPFHNRTVKGHENAVIYEKSSGIEHNCHANCRADSYHEANNMGRMIVRAAMTIEKGNPISINYVSGFHGTAERRKILRTSKFFYCTCERCKDPTELGTMHSALKCFDQQCTGNMLPPTFLVTSGGKIPDFTCDKCNLTTSSETIDEILREIFVKFSKMDEDDENELKRFIHEQAKILHENHFYIVSAEFLCAVLMKKNLNKDDMQSLSTERLKENLTLCKKLIRLLEIIETADYAARGLVLELLGTNTIELASRLKWTDRAVIGRLFKESVDIAIKEEQLFRDEPMNEEEAKRVMENKVILRMMILMMPHFLERCNH